MPEITDNIVDIKKNLLERKERERLQFIEMCKAEAPEFDYIEEFDGSTLFIVSDNEK
jgi:hypothetical protein